MARWEAANAVAIKRVSDEHHDGQIDKREHSDGGGGEYWCGAICGDGAHLFALYSPIHLNDQRFSSVSVANSSDNVKSRMQTDTAAPSGQSYAAPKRLCTTLAIMVPDAPPTSSGARKSPRESTKANVAPASSPGMDSGKIMRRNVLPGVAPRSCEASSSGRGMVSSAA